ncbi:T9SS type A sorting domain-containing protein [Larkinella terrae]|uniref:T9SS type A sorting domain-containing protein n=1 Tax=Larkinella terrae TaxID=2025311 RepID=A0A7K0EEM1_9BACT|nr:T9SS type A sorting domain-containing protein [Larkinella terrae]MRS60031.1 hypothetical protein [Larkinella terrae]
MKKLLHQLRSRWRYQPVFVRLLYQLLLFTLTVSPAFVRGQCTYEGDSYTLALGNRKIQSGDFNKDGQADVVIFDRFPASFSIFLNKGDQSGQLAAPFSYTIGYLSDYAVVADFNKDGYLDIIAGVDDAPNSNLILFRNKADNTGTFQNPVTYTYNDRMEGLFTGDFNNDGYPDLVVKSFETARVLLNDASQPGTFTTPSPLPHTFLQSVHITVGDFNNDGFDDLITAGAGDENLKVWLRKSDGTDFLAPVVTGNDNYIEPLSAGDLNNDGFPDLATNIDYQLAVLLNDGTGRFGPATLYPTTNSPETPLIGDMNGDGLPDLLVPDTYDYYMFIYTNKPTNPGTFDDEYLSNFSIDDSNAGSVLLDLNHDSALDVAMANSSSLTTEFQCVNNVEIDPLTSETECAGSSINPTTRTSNFPAVTYVWSSQPAGFTGTGDAPTLITPTVSSPTIFTLTVAASSAGGYTTRTASVTLLVTPSFSEAPTLTQNGSSNLTVIQNTPSVSLTASTCSGTISWTGSNGTSGTGTSISVPTSTTGTLVYQATCSQGKCTSPVGSATVVVTSPLVTGSFDGFINGADCESFRGWAWDRNKPNTPVSIEILDGSTIVDTIPAGDFRQDLLDAGKGNGKHAFRWKIPESFKDYNTSHLLSARVTGSQFILKDSPKALICVSTVPGNKPPVPPTPTILIAPLAAQVGVPFSATLVPFTDPEGDEIYYELRGLPAGLHPDEVETVHSRFISGIPRQAGTFQLTYLANDAAGNVNSISFPLVVNPASTTAPVTGNFEGYLDKVECGTIRGWVWDRNKPNAPVTVEFYSKTAGGAETVWGSTVANIYRDDLKNAGKGNGAHAYSFTVPNSLKDGVTRVIYGRILGSTYGLKDSGKPLTCSSPAPARLSAETGSELQVTVLGNPVSDRIEVEIRGAEGKPLQLQLTDASGRALDQRQIGAAQAVELQHFSVHQQPAGLLVLRVTSGLKNVTLKMLKR